MSLEWLFIGTVYWRTKLVTSMRLPHAQNYQSIHFVYIIIRFSND